MKKMFVSVLAILSLLVLIVGGHADEFDVLVLTDSSPDVTVTSNQEVLIYGTNTSNSITIESGAKAELINFPGNNEITIEADSENFTVFRSGAVLTLNGENGTILKFPATTNTQILIFNDTSLDCLIQDGQILLGDRVVSTTQEPVTPAYDLSDLQGIWKVHGLASGSGAPWWERATVTIASDGTFTAETTESDGNEDYLSGTFSISSDGEVTMSGNSPPFLANMDSGKSVMVWTDTWSSGSPGTTEIKIATNVDATYTTADLVGTWKVHSLASGQGAPWWKRGIITIASDGSYTASTTQSDGDERNSSGTLSISSDGEITGGTLIGNMDANKTVMVWTDTWISESPGTTEISVLVKELD